jgi:hypothetical protein
MPDAVRHSSAGLQYLQDANNSAETVTLTLERNQEGQMDKRLQQALRREILYAPGREARLDQPRLISDPKHGTLGYIKRVSGGWNAYDVDLTDRGNHATQRRAINALCNANIFRCGFQKLSSSSAIGDRRDETSPRIHQCRASRAVRATD